MLMQMTKSRWSESTAPGANSSGHHEPTSAEPESAWHTSTALSLAELSFPYTA